ncbi:SEFIR domain-containing protein [uncultured Algimonas sp.]|uniref:SEFIR domain-containing protein n=1 Tax=uncultured Algimonas sp. TaxID=1547920 RepID=UPI0026213B59|nr:SEFIR domain-containing protein [uncultured Algimonas sp.]
MSMMKEPPVVYISYSWSSQEHIDRVLELATYLRENGVDVRIDRWNLREGQDANAFMESMVSDPKVDKVIIVSDRAYSEKADAREGGVGTEAQIITPEIFKQKDKTKYLAVVTEIDGDGNAYLPTFYGSRIYVNISDVDSDTESFERIIRWIFGQPSDVAPEIGKKPSYLNSSTLYVVGGAKVTRAVKSLRNNLGSASFDVIDALEAIYTAVDNLGEGFDSEQNGSDFFDSLQGIARLRDECITFFDALILSEQSGRFPEIFEEFIENMYSLIVPGKGKSAFSEWDRDRQRFFVQELLIYLSALLIKRRKYELFQLILGREYFFEGLNTSKLANVSAFQGELRILSYYNSKNNLNRISLFADQQKQRAETSAFSFREIQQADVMLFVVTSVLTKRQSRRFWYPYTLTLVDYGVTFPIFERAKSDQGKAALLKMSGVTTGSEIKSAFYDSSGQAIKGPGMWGDPLVEIVKADSLTD